MDTIAVIDASGVISNLIGEIEYTKGYMPDIILDEIKCEKSRSRIDLYSHKIHRRNPTEQYKERVKKEAELLGYTELSKPDIELAALALEITEEQPTLYSSWISADSLPNRQVICLTKDNVLKVLLTKLGVQLYDSFTTVDKKYLQRCYTCTKIYKTPTQIDFCTLCGHNTVKRVGYKEEEGNTILFLKKDYQYNEKKLTFRGKPIRSQDQKEYKWYKNAQKRAEYKDSKITKSILQEKEWLI
ncbi:hypothetical protein NEOKW01_1880 [Nematocida sp. AWRm80]|nr:hypothetical protein NEOKW01_1880 [Nematocida sp. AWRm80]